MTSEYPRFQERELQGALHGFATRIATALGGYGMTCSDAMGELPFEIVDRADPLKRDATPHGRYWFADLVNADAYVPHAGLPGTYIFFNEQGQGLYVGKAEVGFGWRIAAHIRAQEKPFQPTDYLIVLPFHDAFFLAPAFESYLLDRFYFPYNKSMSRAEASFDSPAAPD